MVHKTENLIVDTTAFINNAPLHEIATNIITVQDVVDEIINKRQLRRLVVLPYDLIIKEVFPENVKIVTEFSKKTGDYPSLSATDIKVMALTYQLEKEKVGETHLRQTPVIQRTVKITTGKIKTEETLTNISGFYCPNQLQETEVKNGKDMNISKVTPNEITYKNNTVDLETNEIETNFQVKPSMKERNDTRTKLETKEEQESKTKLETEEEELSEKFAALDCNELGDTINGQKVDDILVSVTNNKESESDNSEDSNKSDYEDEDDDCGWITPSNVEKAKKHMNDDLLDEKSAIVACMTTDFAMQNVLKQMNLKVAALDGRIIKQIRTFILRCYTCFKTTSLMEKIFCPKCGNKTLKKVAVSLDENGKEVIHINLRKPLTNRGKKFSLPTPKGGKHSNYPILTEDQPVPQQRPSKQARKKNNPLDPDYIAGYSPFVMRDVNSRSALLGIRPHKEIKYWMGKNSNDLHKKKMM